MPTLPYTIALTGGIASGKSTVANYFAEFGVDIIDADLISRQLVAPNQPALAEIVSYFGKQLLTDKGELNRAALRAHIFQHPADKQWLEAYLHPQIRQAMRHRLSQIPTNQYAIAVIPLLQEAGIPDYINRVLVVDCDYETQLKRVIGRDGIEENLAKAMIQQQATRASRLAIADDVIDNPQGLSEEEIKLRCLTLHQHYQLLLTL
jgi:dephospho-CoA kinase